MYWGHVVLYWSHGGRLSADFLILVASDLFLTVFCVSMCLNGPVVVMAVCSPGYRSSSIVVCSAEVLLSSIGNSYASLKGDKIGEYPRTSIETY